MNDQILPNTIIHLPPEQRRSLFANILLGLLVAASLAVVLLIVRVAATPISESESLNDARRPRQVAPQASPIIFEGRFTLELPTATPEPTKAPYLAPTVARTQDYCDPGITQKGDVCELPDPPPPTTTPYPPCSDPDLDPGDRCVWTYEPLEPNPWS